MKAYLLISRMMLKTSFSGLNLFGQYRNDKDSRKVLKTAFALLIILFALGSVVFLEYQIYGLLRQMHQEALLPACAIMLAIMSSLVLGLFQSVSELYKSRDAAWFGFLPVNSEQIYAAKLTSLYVSDLLVNLPIVLPAAILYLSDRPDWVLPALRLIPVFLFLPAIPLAIIALISALLMRISGFARHRDTVMTVLIIVFMLAYLVGVTSFSSMNAAPGGSSAELAAAMTSPDGLFNKLLSVFPPARWAGDGFINSFPMMLLFCAVSAAALGLVFVLTGKGYLDCALSGSETTRTASSKKTVSFRTSSPIGALVRLEVYDLIRCQTYLLNGVLGTLVMPVALMIGVFSGLRSVGESASSFSELFDNLGFGMITVILTGVMFLCTFVNQLPATAISREGRHYPFSLSLPVEQTARLTAKLTVSTVLNAISMILITIPIAIFLPVPPAAIVLAFVLAFALSLAPGALCMLLDARSPKLDWVTETDAMKKNFNSFFCLFLWIAVAAVVGIIVYAVSGIGPTAILIALIACTAVLAGVSLFLLYRIAGKLTYLPDGE